MITRRFDEGRPEYELTGMIEAIEEYDSKDTWYSHLAIRFILTRIKDGKLLYSRQFDKRKKVYEHSPQDVVKVMSEIMEVIMNQVIHDVDIVFGREYGVNAATSNE